MEEVKAKMQTVQTITDTHLIDCVTVCQEKRGRLKMKNVNAETVTQVDLKRLRH